MRLTVWNNDSATEIQAEDGTTILDAVLAAGVRFPYGCKSGECGVCKCQLLSATALTEDPSDPLALSGKDRSRGRILACTARISGSAAIRLPQEDVIDIFSVPAQVVDVKRPSSTIVVFRLVLDRERSFAYQPGQYVQLTFANGVSREYSIANQPGSGELEFHVRHVPGGRASSFAYEYLAAGDPVTVTGPYGNAHLQSAHDGPIIAAGAGTGWAPLKSIITTALEAENNRTVQLLLCTTPQKHFYDLRSIEKLAGIYPNFEFCPVIVPQFTCSTQGAQMLASRLADTLKVLNNGIKLYVAGSHDVVASAKSAAAVFGVSESDIHSDTFYRLSQAQAIAVQAAYA